MEDHKNDELTGFHVELIQVCCVEERPQKGKSMKNQDHVANTMHKWAESGEIFRDRAIALRFARRFWLLLNAGSEGRITHIRTWVYYLNQFANNFISFLKMKSNRPETVDWLTNILRGVTRQIDGN